MSNKIILDNGFISKYDSEIIGELNVIGNITGNTFVVSGGTSNQFLKADGGLDSGTFTTKIDTLTIKSKQLTGFESPPLIDASYNSTDRTITLSGTITAYWRGLPVTVLSGSTWTSDSHPVPTGLGSYFLYYNGSSFVWSTTPWAFTDLMISYVYSEDIKFALKETHGLMDSYSHEQNHFNLGTTLRSGADISNLTINNTTATNRRPIISQSVITDEDINNVLPSLTGSTYSRFQLSGSGSTINVLTGSTEVINLSGNNPYYNQFTGGAWIQTLFSNNAYGKIFIMATPVTSDVESQNYRYLFIQPQTTSTTLSTIQSIGPSSINLGTLKGLVPEFVYVGEIIIRYTGGNWNIRSFSKIIGNKYTQSAIASGQFLTSVATDDTITGNGTAISPLSISTVLGDINTILDNINGQVI